MHESSEFESYGKGHRVFDCPWCGAISGVDPSHVGEHFDCPECHRQTKLTDKNTRQGHISQPPPEAPPHEAGGKEDAGTPHPVKHAVSPWETYGKDHRVFDCPWCGAISSLDPSHLGESYDCPECHKTTKLTDQNTRTGDLVVAPPDAPPHAEAKSRAPLWIGLLVAAAAAVVLAVVLGPGSGKETQPGETPVARGPEVPGGTEVPATANTGIGPDGALGAAPSDEGPTPAEPPGEGGETEAPVEPDTPGAGVPDTPGAGGPSDGETPDAPEPPPAPTPREAAALALEEAQQALAGWEAAHPDQVRELEEAAALRALEAHVLEQVSALESAAVTPAAVRAWNAAIRAWIQASPDRVAMAETFRQRLEQGRARPRRLASWQEINFYEPGVRQGLATMVEDAASLESEEHAALLRAVDAARRQLASLDD